MMMNILIIMQKKIPEILLSRPEAGAGERAMRTVLMIVFKNNVVCIASEVINWERRPPEGERDLKKGNL